MVVKPLVQLLSARAQNIWIQWVYLKSNIVQLRYEISSGQ